MKKNTGAEKLQAAIIAKQAEIEAIAQELEAAAGDAAQYVAAEKKDRRARAELAALQTAHEAASYMPPEPTDREELLQGLEKYKADHKARIDKITAEIRATESELTEIEIGLQDAAEKADTARTIKLSGKKEELQAAKGHLLEMLNRAAAMPVYPAGAIREEWQAICTRLLPEFENRVQELATLAGAYKAAADSLLTMQQTIMDVREQLERTAGGEYLPTVFTAGKTSDELIVNKVYQARIYSMFAPIGGQAI